MSASWKQTLFPEQPEAEAWELFHENSKNVATGPGLTDEAVVAVMREMWQSLPYENGRPPISLPEPRIIQAPLGEVMNRRVSCRAFEPKRISLSDLSTILHYGYGISRTIGEDNPSLLERALRTVPSGGGLYPLEIFFWTDRADGLQRAVYHYYPPLHDIRPVREDVSYDRVADVFVDRQSVSGAALVIFISALFKRSTFKYRNRGYRFTFLEAGHVAQNINLAATGLGLGSLNIGGFNDWKTDELLGLDGLEQSTIYTIAVGMPWKEREPGDKRTATDRMA